MKIWPHSGFKLILRQFALIPRFEDDLQTPLIDLTFLAHRSKNELYFRPGLDYGQDPLHHTGGVRKCGSRWQLHDNSRAAAVDARNERCRQGLKKSNTGSKKNN